MLDREWTTQNLVQSLASIFPGLAKIGVIATQKYGLEKGLALEALQKYGWSLDVGATQTQGYLGISKDIIKNDKIELDVGAGMTTAKQGYVGAHISF